MKKTLKINVMLISFIFGVFFIFPFGAEASNTGLIIDEFQISGENAYDEFVVIANYGIESLNLSDYSLARKSKDATAYNTLFNTTVNYILKPGQKVKIGHEKYVGKKDFTYSTLSYSITADNTIAILGPNKEAVDFVGFGKAFTYEGAPTALPEAGQIYSRTQGIDTDNNFKDFVLLNVTKEVDPNLNKLQITEIFPSPVSGQEEWFEIFNPTNLEVDVDGAKVCDGAGSVHCYELKGKIAPFGFLVLTKTITKITLNNDGDWLELVDPGENIIFETENYGDAESDTSFSLFGSSWDWTLVTTKGSKNVFTSIVEEEKPKATKKKTIKKSKKVTKANVVEDLEAETGESFGEEGEIKGAKDEFLDKNEKKKITQKEIGYGIIGLAFMIFCGYILWENKEKIRGIYTKFTRRNN